MSKKLKETVGEKIKASSHSSYGLMTFVSVLVPLAGIIMGAIFLTKDAKVDRKLGEHLIAVGILVSIIVTGLWFLVVPGIVPAATSTDVVPAAVTTSPVAPAWNIDENYAKVSKGMTREAVETAIGKTAANCSEVEQSGSSDRYSACTYGGPGDGGMIVVNYVNGIVNTTEKAKY